MRDQLHNLAAALLPSQPIYLVLESDGPPQEFITPESAGQTGRRFDLALRGWLTSRGEWCGRRPAILLNDIRLREALGVNEGERILPAILTHELAHVVEHRADLSEPTEEAEADAKLRSMLAVAAYTLRPQSAIPEPWWGHGADFIRIAMHLHHRAWQAGYEIGCGDIFCGPTYGLSPHWQYMHAIRPEPQRREHEDIFQILNTDAPAAFVSLWKSDTQAKELNA